MLPVTPPARAADQPLTLHSAIEQAVAGNPDLRRERIAIDTADGRLESARGLRRQLAPTSPIRAPRGPRSAPRISRPAPRPTFNLDLGIPRNLETGGNVNLGRAGTRSKTNCGLSVRHLDDAAERV